MKTNSIERVTVAAAVGMMRERKANKMRKAQHLLHTQTACFLFSLAELNRCLLSVSFASLRRSEL